MYNITWSSDWGVGSIISLVLWQYTGVDWNSQWLFSKLIAPVEQVYFPKNKKKEK